MDVNCKLLNLCLQFICISNLTHQTSSSNLNIGTLILKGASILTILASNYCYESRHFLSFSIFRGFFCLNWCIFNKNVDNIFFIGHVSCNKDFDNFFYAKLNDVTNKQARGCSKIKIVKKRNNSVQSSLKLYA